MIGHLQQLHEQYKDKGLVLIGINVTDSKGAAGAFLRKYGVTFINISDTSKEARQVISGQYHDQGVPLEYVIDQDGKIVLGWYGDVGPGVKALGKLGIK